MCEKVKVERQTKQYKAKINRSCENTSTLEKLITKYNKNQFYNVHTKVILFSNTVITPRLFLENSADLWSFRGSF